VALQRRFTYEARCPHKSIVVLNPAPLSRWCDSCQGFVFFRRFTPTKAMREAAATNGWRLIGAPRDPSLPKR
jgi:hypothetical protein